MKAHIGQRAHAAELDRYIRHAQNMLAALTRDAPNAGV
jgi:hypothetical protein